MVSKYVKKYLILFKLKENRFFGGIKLVKMENKLMFFFGEVKGKYIFCVIRK